MYPVKLAPMSRTSTARRVTGSSRTGTEWGRHNVDRLGWFLGRFVGRLVGSRRCTDSAAGFRLLVAAQASTTRRRRSSSTGALMSLPMMAATNRCWSHCYATSRKEEEGGQKKARKTADIVVPASVDPPYVPVDIPSYAVRMMPAYPDVRAELVRQAELDMLRMLDATAARMLREMEDDDEEALLLLM